jgi:ABC-type branched-subunit amino acid transport system ATPase component
VTPTVTGPPVLETRDVRVRFGGVTALAGVNLSVPPASLVGLVGPNGAGKSTLFGVCSGLLKPTTGRVFLSGRDITGATAQLRARLGMARTFQQPELFLGLTVREHLTLAHRVTQDHRCVWKEMFTPASIRKPDPSERAPVQSILDLLGLDGVARAAVDALPLGTSRLVEVGRALATQPSVVLLDEPFAGLDTAEAAMLAEALIRTVRETGVALVLVEHDVAMVLGLCEWIVVLDFGRVIAEGVPDAVRSDPAVKAAYLGDDPAGGTGVAEGASGPPATPGNAPAPR